MDAMSSSSVANKQLSRALDSLEKALPLDDLLKKIDLIRTLIPTLTGEDCDRTILRLNNCYKKQGANTIFAHRLTEIITTLQSERPYIVDDGQGNKWSIPQKQMEKLAAQSGFFKNIFASSFREVQTRSLTLPGYTAEDLKLLLDVLEDPKKINEENALNIFEMADYFDCNKLLTNATFIHLIAKVATDVVSSPEEDEIEMMCPLLSRVVERLPSQSYTALDAAIKQKIATTENPQLQLLLIDILKDLVIKRGTLTIPKELFTEIACKILEKCQSLDRLTIKNRPDIDQLLSALPKSITVLSLSECSALTHAGIAQLDTLTNLRWLNLDGCKQFKEAASLPLANLTSLKILSLEGCSLTAKEIIQLLRQLPRLEQLNTDKKYDSDLTFFAFNAKVKLM